MLLPILFASAAAMPIVPDARFALALYCNPRCDDDVLDKLDDALGDIDSDDSFSDQVATPVRIMGIGGVDFGIPDADFIATFGPDISNPEGLQRSEMVVLAWFAGPREQSMETFAIAHAAFADAASRASGWVEDLDTQLLFDAEGWRSRDPRGPLSDWFVVEPAPMNDGTDRLHMVTRGLRRFGDFELAVDGVAPEAGTDVGWVLDAVAATLHPLGEVHDEESVDAESARGTAKLEVATPRDDDPQGPILRVRFVGEVLVSPEPAIAAAVDVTVVSEPSAAATPIPEPAPVLAPAPAPAAPQSLAEATARVRTDLAGLEAAWRTGLPAGDVLAVNVPMNTRFGGLEYLWVEVSRWEAGGLSGRVVSEPYEVPGVQRGDTLNFRQSEVYDYIYKRADGTKSGSLTKAFR